MASADTYDEAIDSAVRGWRPFYVRKEGDPIPPAFFSCPASKEAGQKTDCVSCGACKGGTNASDKRFPTIAYHGVSWKRLYHKRGMKRFEQKKAYVGKAWEKMSPAKAK